MNLIGEALGTNSKFHANSSDITEPSEQDMQALMQQQRGFVGALQNQANGGGPSAAQAMLNNANQQQASTASALAASQQGNVNAGLATRNAQMMAAQGQQANAAQGSVMRNQEQLQAQNMLGGQLNSMAGQGIQAQGMNQQSRMEANKINAGVADKNAQNNSNMFGQLFGAGSKALVGGAYGGSVPHYSGGGQINTPGISDSPSFASRFLKGMGSGDKDPKTGQPSVGPGTILGSALGAGIKTLLGSTGGSQTPESLAAIDAKENNAGEYAFRPGNAEEVQLANNTPSMMARGGPANLKQGGKVSGQAKVSGDSLKNDTVPAMLSPKEIVLPRSVTLHPEAPQKAAEFVAAIMAKNRGRK